MNYTLQVSHYGYVMETGKITLEGPSEMLFHNDYVRHAYLGVWPFPRLPLRVSKIF